ncbi:MAG: TrkA family potassium uptake protein [Candidatus Aquicultor sp.]|nr:TrkA family potassium uptake protein [Candidatus Aquicultor sp.]
MYIVISGCGRVGAQLATMLSDDGHNVVVIDSDGGSFRRLGTTFNGLTIVGNGFDEQVLEKAGIQNADIFIAVTNLDNTNIMAGQVAKKLYNVQKVISRVYYPDREKTYHKLGLETVCGTTLVARKIRDFIIGREFVSEVNLDFNTQLAEIKASSTLAGKKVGDVEIPNEFKPVIIIRGGASMIVGNDTKIAVGDTIIAAVSASAVQKITRYYGVEVRTTTAAGLSCPI